MKVASCFEIYSSETFLPVGLKSHVQIRYGAIYLYSCKFRPLHFTQETLTLRVIGAIYYLVRRRQFLRAFQGFPGETGLMGRAAPRLHGSGDASWLHR